MVETLFEKPLLWLNGEGAHADIALFSCGSVVRNLADLPFPARCSEEELRTAEDRVLTMIESDDFAISGQYCAMDSLDEREVLFLRERGLISDEFILRKGPRGVWVSEDQGLCIIVNGTDHVRVQAYASGLEFDSIWNRLSDVDDVLARGLDYAFDEKLGYLTSSTGSVGTGLILRVVLHLPVLDMNNRIATIDQELRTEHHCLQPHMLAGTGTRREEGQTQGELYSLRNTATLGRSEPEIVYHINHAASDLIAQEEQARRQLYQESQRGVEDRVGRARGLAREVRLLEVGEANALLSSLRLGVAMNLLEGITIRQLNEALMASRRGHLEMKLGQDCDDLTLSMERADLFRARFS